MSKLTDENRLSVQFPELLKEWDYEKNVLSPDQVSYGSHKSVFWSCNKGHFWKAEIINRALGKQKCPYCSGKRSSKENNLSLHSVSKEFDKEKNFPLTPKDFTLNSSKKVWWICSKNKEHQWEAIIKSRTKQNNGCPYCRGYYPSKENNLSLHPASKEFDKEKNFPLTPKDFTLGSFKKVWWKCEKGHSWKITIASRTGKRNRGCPWCGGWLVLEEKKLHKTHPHLEKDFDEEKNEFSFSSLSQGTHKKVWWKCEKGHSYKNTPYNRIKDVGCPYCAGQKPSKENNLSLHPVSKEFHPEKNKDAIPENFTMLSNKKVWWKCKKKGHEWKGSINNRTNKHILSGCPECAKNTYRSKGEIALFEWCKKTFPKIKIEANNRKVLDGLEIDIYFPELRKGIEFNGNYFHSRPKTIKRDKRKLQEAKKQGIEIMVIWENEWNDDRIKIENKVRSFVLNE